MKIFTIISFILLGYLAKLNNCDSSEIRSPFPYCTDLKPQNGVDLEQIMGMWYGSEIITHRNDNNDHGTFYYDTCVIIHLSDVTDEIGSTTVDPAQRDWSTPSRTMYHKRNNRFLRLIWDEKNTNLEYTLKYNDSRRGFWISYAPQKGSWPGLQYSQFSGTIQVIKAVSNQLVLTFCNNVPGSELFTVVLTRQPDTLTSEDIQGIRNILKRRQLITAQVRKVCHSGATNFILPSIVLLFLTFVININSF